MAAAAVATMRYQQLCLLASGGMADLHLARTTGPGGFERLVVVKRLRPQLADSPDLVQMLLDEARIAATLQHNHIVQVHDVTFEGGSVSVVMEYLHGQDARALMKRARTRVADGGLLPLDQAIAIALGTCAGLHHAHERVDAGGKPLDIVHRDVSPDNVVVTFDGGVKLIDFGIARARSRLGQTEQGIAKGKPGYMAPEQILCRPVDRRADVYAAAVLLYEMTCGRLPYDGESDYERFNAAVDDDPIRPRTLAPGYPKELEEIVLRGLERDPDRRYQTALAMQRALEEFARSRRLDLSSFALAQLMERLCSDKLDAWRTAQRAGRSLAEHVAALRTSSAGVAPAAQPPVQTRTRRRRALVGFGLVALAAAGPVWWWQTRPGPGAASASPEVEAPAPASPPEPPREIDRAAPPERVADIPASPGPDHPADPSPARRERRARRHSPSAKPAAPSTSAAEQKPKPPAAEAPADPDAFLPY